MRPHYMDQPTPDEDDRVLYEARANGHVPAACVLGGVVLGPVLESGLDPCARCDLPNVRIRCGGRPRQAGYGDIDLGELPRRLSNDAAGGRQILRARQRQALSLIVTEHRRGRS